MSDTTYKGSCFCGAVGLEVTGEPIAAGYCHCGDCRSWSASPVNAFSLWKPESVKITKGKEHIGTYNKTERSYRKFCKVCGGHLMSEHPQWNVLDVYSAVIPDYSHHASVHVHYQETVLPIRDGIPKMKDMPANLGGSGVVLPE